MEMMGYNVQVVDAVFFQNKNARDCCDGGFELRIFPTFYFSNEK